LAEFIDTYAASHYFRAKIAAAHNEPWRIQE
jgi:hypothetical protein